MNTEMKASEEQTMIDLLNEACTSGDLDLVMTNCTAATVNCTKTSHFSPLHFAIINNHLHIVEYLVNNGANLQYRERKQLRSAFYLACEFSHLEIARFLFERSALLELTDAEGCTALFTAVRNGSYSIIQCLCSFKADLNKEDSWGRTALSMACGNDVHNLPIVRCLCENGADTNKTSYAGGPPIGIRPANPNPNSNPNPTPTPTPNPNPNPNPNPLPYVQP